MIRVSFYLMMILFFTNASKDLPLIIRIIFIIIKPIR